MEKINFTKMEGAGNDYVYIDLFSESVKEPEKLAVEISHRHFGVGSDGLVLIAPSKVADIQMIMYNSDGSKSEMCGNAIRCVGKYSWEKGLVKKKIIKIETGAGIKLLKLNVDNSSLVQSASVEMGIPELDAQKIPSTLHGPKIIDQQFIFEDISLSGTLVSMGNPHIVIYVNDVSKTPVQTWGPMIENAIQFPNRINVEFVQVINRKEVKQRTWERGAGETWACGTGASAVCVAGVLTGKTDESILIHLTGGDLQLTWKGKKEPVIKEGPAREVFSGVWTM